MDPSLSTLKCGCPLGSIGPGFLSAGKVAVSNRQGFPAFP